MPSSATGSYRCAEQMGSAGDGGPSVCATFCSGLSATGFGDTAHSPCDLGDLATVGLVVGQVITTPARAYFLGALFGAIGIGFRVEAALTDPSRRPVGQTRLILDFAGRVAPLMFRAEGRDARDWSQSDTSTQRARQLDNQQVDLLAETSRPAGRSSRSASDSVGSRRRG